MNSKNIRKPLSSSSPPPEKRPPYKFLQRTLKIDNQDPVAYQIFHVKRLHIKKLLDPQEHSVYRINYKFISKLFKDTKLTKTLHHAHVSSFLEPYVHENFKNLKRLRKYTFCFHTDRKPTNGILLNLKKLPPQVQEIRLEVSGIKSIAPTDLYRISKYIPRFHKLKLFRRIYSDWCHKDQLILPQTFKFIIDQL